MYDPVRDPAVAGSFYHADPETLKDDVKELFADIKTDDYFSVISPHAGYMYSGRTAAKAISSLRPAETFVIIGPNHSLMGPEFSIMGHGSWKTPLGEVKINEELAQQLKRNKILEDDGLAHEQEHSIEVQLPLLQYRFDKFDFIPISVANTSYSETFLEHCISVGETIAQFPEVSIIASSDFSHYVPLKTAKRYDMEAIKYVEEMNIEGFFDTLRKHNASVCGFGPIAILMSIMKKSGKKGKLIAYTSSGETTQDYNSVVAYAAIGFK
jgi:AmmeMemoRadiSam system protein B